MRAQTFTLELTDGSRVSEARRLGRNVASGLDLSEQTIANAEIVISEAATNVVKHAGSGLLQLRSCDELDIPGLELLVIDSGPGIANLNWSQQDGVSTAGTLGGGLGAIRRLSSFSDIYTIRNKGTFLVARFHDERPSAKSLQVGVVQTPMRGEAVCGDAYELFKFDDGFLIVVADGLGHGHHAAEASQQACKAVAGNTDLSPADLIKRVHEQLRATRGAAVSIARFYSNHRIIRYAGVGNVTGVILHAGRTTQMISHNGTAGHEVRRIQQFEYSAPPDSTLLMYSDGLSSRWNTALLPAIQPCHPSLQAAVLYHESVRGRDDATIVAAAMRAV